jgi:hypothetical protein
MAWDALQDVPSPAVVENGAHITYGANKIWGVFPTSAEDATYAAYYGPLSGSPSWTIQDEDGFAYYMTYTSATFQWLEDGVLFVIGSEDGDPVMHFHNLYDNEWDSDDLPFSLGAGASIAYQPNVNYNRQMTPVPGWIYCLSGGSTDFWRYAIPTSLPNMALDGIYPGSGAVIADQTPLFQWADTTQQQHRLLVSTDALFGDTVLDKVTSNPEYQDSSVLANGTYYWRTAAWVSSAWSWGLTHSFELDGGWSQLAQSVPYSVGSGAAIAYDADAYGHPSILAFLGGGGYYFYEYNVCQPGWTAKDPTDKAQNAGTSLSTPEPVGEGGHYPWAAFGGEGTSDYPYYLDVYHEPDPNWTLFDPSNDAKFPEIIGSDASMVVGPNPYIYLTVGDNNFYRLDPPSLGFDGGMAAGATRTSDARAHSIARFDAVEVEYQLEAARHVRATLHDAVGRQVGACDAGEQTRGIHRLSWKRDCEGRKLSPGAYFVLLDTGTEQVRLKAVVR